MTSKPQQSRNSCILKSKQLPVFDKISKRPISDSSIYESPIIDDKLNEERSYWLTQILTEYPHILAMRESSLKISGGFSFTQISHTQTFTAQSILDRHIILELIYQYLQAIGMYRTAEILCNESGHLFQKCNQPWDRTDLRLLASLAVSYREDPWNVLPDQGHHCIIEYLEEDFFSSPYREDPKSIWNEYFNNELNCVFSDAEHHDYHHLIAASLKRLIVYQCTSNIRQINDEDQQLFFLTIHSITSAEHFLSHIVELFDFNFEGTQYTLRRIDPQIKLDIRMNIINLIKKWINYHGLFIGKKTIGLIRKFLARIYNEPEHEKIGVYIIAILKSMENITYGSKKGTSNYDKIPKISNPQVLFKPSLTILDPDPLEVARQITLIHHKKYSSIHSLEFIVALKSRKATIQTQTLNDFLQFGEHITKLFLETYLNSNNKDFAYDRIYEIIMKLKNLGNLDAIACLTQLMLREDVCSFLKNVETLETKKNKLLEMWKYTGENDKNETKKPTVYDECLEMKFTSWDPCIPNMHVEIKRIDKNMLKKSDFVDGLINWEKMKKLAERCTILYRFQNMRYNYYTIPQIENVILKGSKMSIEELLNKLQDEYLYRKENNN